MRNRLLLSMLGFGLAAFLMGSATMAWFTSQTTNTGNTFASGTIEIQATRPSATWTGVYDNMAPGQKVNTNITVKNIGTLTMKYRMYGSLDTGSDAGLAGKLILTIKDAGGSQLYSGPLAGFDLSHAFTRTGDKALAPTAEEVLSLEVELPTSADNTVRGKSVSVTFTFDATQPENGGWSQTN